MTTHGKMGYERKRVVLTEGQNISRQIAWFMLKVVAAAAILASVVIWWLSGFAL
jgi:hypothetical protein